MFNLNYALVIASVSVICCGQLIFKVAAKNLVLSGEQAILPLIRANAFPLSLIAAALLLYLLSTFAWVYALRSIPLSIAFMFNALAFAIVPISAFLLFGEQVPRLYFPGLLLIVIGIALVTLS